MSNTSLNCSFNDSFQAFLSLHALIYGTIKDNKRPTKCESVQDGRLALAGLSGSVAA